MARRSLTGPISMILGYALLASSAQAAPAASESDAFGIVDLPAGYALDRMHGEGEGKCGEGKCGEGKGDAEGKCGEGKCGGDGKGDAEGKCGEGKCGGDAKGDTEGKCGEGKCGGSH